MQTSLDFSLLTDFKDVGSAKPARGHQPCESRVSYPCFTRHGGALFLSSGVRICRKRNTKSGSGENTGRLFSFGERVSSPCGGEESGGGRSSAGDGRRADNVGCAWVSGTGQRQHRAVVEQPCCGRCAEAAALRECGDAVAACKSCGIHADFIRATYNRVVFPCSEKP